MASLPASPLRSSGNSPGIGNHSMQDASFLSQSLLDGTLHSTRSLSGRASILTYNNKQYPSASAALAAYISDFDGSQPPSKTYHRTVEDLLTPRSVLLRTVDRSLDTGVRDTRAEWKRYVSKKLLDESYSQMAQADEERQRAQDLIESSQLLAADMSPLPGSSVITEVESQVTVSTDALLLAPPYPPPRHPPLPQSKDSTSARSSKNGSFRRGADHQRGMHSGVRRAQSLRDRAEDESGRRASTAAAKPRLYSPLLPKFPSNISPVKKGAMSSGATSQKRSLPLDNPELAQVLHSESLSLSQRGRERHREGVVSHEVSKTSHSHGLPRKRSPVFMKEDGRRPPPSWIQDLDVSGVSGLTSGTNCGGRGPPSWIHDLDASGVSGLTSGDRPGGRAPPSWVQDLEVSRVSRPTKMETEEQVDGGRPPPSWIQDLNSTLTSGWPGSIDTSKPVRNRYLPLKDRTTQKLPGGDILRRPKSAHEISEIHNVTELSEKLPPGLTFHDFDSSESFLRNTKPARLSGDFERSQKVDAFIYGVHHSGKAVKFPEASRPEKAYSFTTDDLILASPTGKGFHTRDHHSRRQSSQQNGSSRDYPPQVNSEHRPVSVNGYGNSPSTSQRGYHESARGAGSSKGRVSGSLSSTPKHRVAFTSDLLNHLSRHADDVGSSGSRRGYLMDQHAGKTKGVLEEDERRREEALLQRAQRVLDAARASRSEQSHPHPGNHLQDADRQEDADRHDNSLLTEEILEGDRPWERKVPLRKPLGSDDRSNLRQQDFVAQFLDDCLKSSQESQKLTGGSQPGPVEALKNMLFTLQSIAPTSPESVARNASSPTGKEEPRTVLSRETSSTRSSRSKAAVRSGGASRDSHEYQKDGRSPGSPSSMPSLDRDPTPPSSGTSFDEAPGGKSLQRAMEHLSRLKVLVNGGGHRDSQPSSTGAQVTST